MENSQGSDVRQCSFFFKVQQICALVCVETVAGAFKRLPLPAVAWQGDTAADSS